MTSPNPPSNDLPARYREALQALVEPQTEPNPLRGLGTLPPEEVLELVEQQILREADERDELGDGIDPIILIAKDLDSPLATHGFVRRCEQIKAESGEDVLGWVLNRTESEHQKRTTIGVARMQLLVALDQIEQSLDEAQQAVKDLDYVFDPQIVSGPAKHMLTAAFDQIRLLTAGAATYAPKLED